MRILASSPLAAQGGPETQSVTKASQHHVKLACCSLIILPHLLFHHLCHIIDDNTCPPAPTMVPNRHNT